jgi:hypothetical protein
MTTTMIFLNALMSGATVAALALVVRSVHRIRHQRAETLHPSQPIPLRLAAEDAERTLARAA